MQQTSQQQPQPKTSNQPKFGLNIPPNAFSQFTQDVLGVWAPKIPLTRSWTQLFEDAFLENVENFAFYFTIPVVAPYMAKGLAQLYKKSGKALPWEAVGSSWKDLGKSASQLATKEGQQGARMLGTKMGTLLGVVALAGGYEYMIQHVKNVITAKSFGTKNFTAVAGLEGKQNKPVSGEMDPVEKTKRRALQVAAIMASGFGLAAAMPALATRSGWVKNVSAKILEYCNFSSTTAKNGKKIYFDITKPILATLAGIGAVSYIDAGRDTLERKETGSRLLLVIPYMIVGKELAKNFLAWSLGKWTKTSLTTGENPLKVALKPERFLKLDVVKEDDAIKAALKGKSAEFVKSVLNQKKWVVDRGAFALSALVCGLGINWMSYEQTKTRFRKQQAQRALDQQKQQLALQPVQPVQGQIVHQSYGGFAAQGKPLQDPNSAARPVPRPQAPFGGARVTGNPYGYGQWRV